MFKALTALMVAAAWGALGYGLVFSRPDVGLPRFDGQG